jgi:GNAT superfamily N-acetyltransferase
MKHLKLFENFNESIVYDESHDFGSIQGVIHYDVNRVNNWLSKRRLLPDDYEENITLPMAFLNNINVDEESRGNNYGFAMYDNFEDWCIDNGARAIMLESDSDEEQQEGFDLDSWYEKLGFHEVGIEGGNKIFIKNLYE